jgi:hypothetical protein
MKMSGRFILGEILVASDTYWIRRGGAGVQSQSAYGMSSFFLEMKCGRQAIHT